jgi:TPP-dependent pyruvate/acetoin dehydrogenase alpha subunit
LIDDRARQQMEREILDETLAAFDHATNSPNPVEADLYRNVYAS